MVATVIDRIREILLWKLLVSLAEAGSFSAEHLCVNFHRTLIGSNTKPDGSAERPFVIDIASLHRGLGQIARGIEINPPQLGRKKKPKPLHRRD